MRYKAWGEVRYNWGSTPTDYQFTGQYSHQSDFGLMFYQSRFYDPSLSRFASPDTIIPGNQGVQAWDRYAYTNNNPLRYTDPTGHKNCEEDGYNCPGDDIKQATQTPTPTMTITPRPTLTSYPTTTPTITPTICPQAFSACVPTPTPTPSPTQKPWKPAGQEAGEWVADGIVTIGEQVADFCFGSPDGYAGDGCGELTGKLMPLRAQTGTYIDFFILGIHFSYAVSTTMIVSVQNYATEFKTMTPMPTYPSPTPSATLTPTAVTPTYSATPFMSTPTFTTPTATPSPWMATP